MTQNKQVALYEVTFRDEIEADSEEEAYDDFLKYLAECVHHQDVTAFQFRRHFPDKLRDKLSNRSLK
tara:strand:+ start:26698 stop:26898 length:201 start_codon:yes stop_codon:yes gene_type:complete